MMRLDEYDLELAQAMARRLERDDEHERFDARRQAVARRPRYSRFRTLARITDAIAAAHDERIENMHRQEAA
jgi:hypothetical protein